MKNKNHIVIIDDAEYKQNSIAFDMHKLFPDAQLHLFDSSNPAMRYLILDHKQEISENPDEWLIMLDMQMPLNPGGEIEMKCGVEVLYNLRRLANQKVDVIMVSSDRVNDDSLRSIYKGYIGHVTFNSSVYMLPLYEELLNQEPALLVKDNIIIVNSSVMESHLIRQHLEELYPDAEYHCFLYMGDALNFAIHTNDINDAPDYWLMVVNDELERDSFKCSNLSDDAGSWLVDELFYRYEVKFDFIMTSIDIEKIEVYQKTGDFQQLKSKFKHYFRGASLVSIDENVFKNMLLDE